MTPNRFFITFVFLVFSVPVLLGQSESLAELPLTVANKEGNAIGDLTKDDLVATMNGKPISIVALEKVSLPMLYVLAVDNSGSMRQQLDAIVAATKALIATNSGSDRAAVMRFVGRTQTQMTGVFTSDKQKLFKVADNFYIEGGQTVIIDPIFLAAKVFAAMPSSSDFAKSVVVISDGEDRNSEATLEQLFELTHKQKVRVYFIGLVEDLDSSARGSAKKFIQDLTSSTGGFAVFPKKKGNLSESAKAIGTALRSPFVLKFMVPAETKRGSKIEIRLAKESPLKDASFSYNPIY
ncbi:MAG: VWA domain-containing protein [Pyrinomonadaceae bacterium]